MSFTATKKVDIKKKVEFTTGKGEKVSFKATKKAPRKAKVSFLASEKKRT